MIAPDANLLIYSYSSSSPFHAASRMWLESILSASEPVGIPFYSIAGFIRFMTHPRLEPRPIRFGEASAIINSWLALSHVRILYPGDRHWQVLQQISLQVRIAGAQTTDATIAAIAMEYGAIIHTNDRDFARFPGLRWHNPLQG